MRRRCAYFLKQPRLWFLALYPALIILFERLAQIVSDHNVQYPLVIGLLLYALCGGIVIMAVLTLSGRLVRRELQGQKLALREKRDANE